MSSEPSNDLTFEQKFEIYQKRQGKILHEIDPHIERCLKEGGPDAVETILVALDCCCIEMDVMAKKTDPSAAPQFTRALKAVSGTYANADIPGGPEESAQMSLHLTLEERMKRIEAIEVGS